MLHIQESQRLITHRNTGAYVKVVAADSISQAAMKDLAELCQFGPDGRAGPMVITGLARGAMHSHSSGE